MSESLSAPIDVGIPSPIAFDRSEIESTIPARWAKVVAAGPDRIALSGNGRSLSFGELDRLTTLGAQAIRRHARRKPGCVALIAEHSPAMVIGVLSILKSGSACLCLHPRSPAVVHRRILADAMPGMLLHDAAHADAVRAIADDIRTGAIEAEGGAIDAALATDGEIRAADPAVIFYTSGSTGDPKGVVKSHRCLLHRAWLASIYDGVAPSDRQSLLTSCSFASSEADLFGALLNGASVHLFDVGGHSLEDFGNWIDANRITLLHPPVVLFRRYLAPLERSVRHSSIRLIALAGDAVNPNDLQRWRHHFDGELRHRFSSTEAGHVAVACMKQDDPIDSVPPATGVCDKALTIVDETGRPTPTGTVGELVVTSRFLSDGYWRRPQETAQVYTVDSADPEVRSFRTGDLGLMREDGRFLFQGRRDDQVKIRGYRIELAEVRREMEGLPGVREVAALADRSGNEARIAAFIVFQPGTAENPSTIRRRLADLLAPWKIPAVIEAVETLPLTLTGKIDRQSLLKQIERQATQESIETPEFESQTVRSIHEIWCNLFGRKEIGIDDHFLDLGGHSLLAAQLIDQMRSRFGRSFALATVAERPTIRQLAEMISLASAPPSNNAAVISLRKSGNLTTLFLISRPDNGTLLYVPLCRLLTTDRPIYVLGFSDDRSACPDFRSTPDMASWLIARLREVQPAGPYLLGGHSHGGVLAYEMARQLHQQGEKIERLLLIDARSPGARRYIGPHLTLTQRLRRRLSKLRRKIWPGKATPKHESNIDRVDPFADAAAASRRQARVSVVREYRPDRYEGAITLLRSIEPPEPGDFEPPGPMNGWDRVCSRIEVHAIPGNHHTMLLDANLTVLATAIDSACST